VAGSDQVHSLARCELEFRKFEMLTLVMKKLDRCEENRLTKREPEEGSLYSETTERKTLKNLNFGYIAK
jgi:hypothetical protein